MDTQKTTNLPEMLNGVYTRSIVGDGGSPNIFFVTNQITGNVLAVFIGDEHADAAVTFADSSNEPLMVEDRQTGVYHDNPAGERLQDRCGKAEDGEWGEDYCPQCQSSNVSVLEGAVQGHRHKTCRECSYQWSEISQDLEETG
jgi:hypothetical protein